MRIPISSDVTVDADLDMVEPSGGLVVFAHGTGSSRHSPRNRFVADQLRGHGLDTLLLDLLTPREGVIDTRTRQLRFDVDLLATRLAAAALWARKELVPESPVGYFGASTGAAAALIAAADHPEDIAAVVSRGGRPDLAGDRLGRVRVPTLLIVGGADATVLQLNEQARARLRCESELEVVAGATHLFEEPGALEEVARLAATWFTAKLGSSNLHTRRSG